MDIARMVAAGLAAIVGVTHLACAATITGTVFVDRNGDRLRQPDEPGVSGAVVALDRNAFVVTASDGTYRLDVATAGEIVWVSVPDGFRPGPVWKRVTPGELDLGLVPLTPEEAAAPLTFVIAADSHTTNNPADPWDGGDLGDAIDQAVALPYPARFFAIVGDITQGNRVEEFERVEAALEGVTTPWVSVPGNHDWYDGGVTWRSRWGPDNYSFDIGDIHVIVWDTNLSDADQLAFVAADLGMVPPDRTIVALGHASPRDSVADEMANLGVDYMFTGHWHANRRVERPGLIEWGTQTFLMGSIDQSPSGYRIVTFHDGVPMVEHRARLVEPHLGITAPHAGSCARSGADVMVAAALDAALPRVTARVDCGNEIELVPRGGWAFSAQLPDLAAGTHSITLRAESPTGRMLERLIAFEVCEAGEALPVPGDWPQLGGGPAHAGARPAPLEPPLRQLWATPVGSNVVLGSPVVAAGIVVVSATDLGAGDEGGLVALDLATGEELWRYVTAYQVRNAPAISGDTVVVALANGEVHAVGLDDGVSRWVHDAADGLSTWESSLWAAPTIADGAVFVALQGRMTAIDLATGEQRWANELIPVYPWLGTLAAVTVADGLAIANYSRDDGMTAWSVTTGAKVWEIKTGKSLAVNATPVAVDGELFFANSYGTVTSVDVANASQIWSNGFTPGGFDWGYSITAAPAVADGRIFFPTQWKDLVAIDAASGAELWRTSTPRGPINFAHYRSGEPGFAASPVVTGDILWVPRPDGKLAALAASDGRELWVSDLGAPVVSAPAPAGDYLVVATFDGTVRAMVPGTAVAPGEIEPCEDLPEPPLPADAGCCGSGATRHPQGASTLALLVFAVLHLRWRRRACAR
ncbi:MAG: PQQ-binding-like beta-propeller repeat protein [Deltaproteobacteria bacterium]|nr:PQQ-binding-like beta-propeller repeat protein [Kofleriaceae bacterium]